MTRSRRILQDTLTAVRERVTIDQAGFLLYPNGERHLRSLEVLQRVLLIRHPDRPAVRQSILAACVCGYFAIVMPPLPGICTASSDDAAAVRGAACA